MCGIAGVLDWRGLANSAWSPAPALLAEMAATLHHRGPDGRGFLSRPAVGLAHTRLAIVDLAGGDQPIFNEDGRIAVVFNGEIFNHVELRAELQAQGHRFATRSDTEVIVHLYEQHGDDFVHHLNGQFAIALWDGRDDARQRLLLVRDRVGIAPLHYRLAAHEGEHQLVFGSEAKAILAAMPQAPEVNRRALDQVFTCWSPVGGETLFDGIRSLEPGTLLVAERDRDFALRHRILRYWDWSFPTSPDGHLQGSDDALLEQVRELLIDATRLRLRADVPVGAYLSGGLDSSILTSLIHHESDAPLRTFSIGFDDPSLDESAHQQRVIDFLGARHSRIDCTSADVGQALVDTVRHTECAVLRTAPVPMRLLSGLVRREGHKVVLTGEGADEVFGGYDLFKEAKVRWFWARQPASSWRPALLKRLYPYLAQGTGRADSFVRGFYGIGLDDPDDPLFSHLPRFDSTSKARIFLAEPRPDGESLDAVRALMPADAARWHPMARAQYLEARLLMGNYLLSSQGDRMLMANGVEGRFPFLDHRVIELANRLPQRLKVRGLNEKIGLKLAMGRYLPPQTQARHKQPYRAPDAAALIDPATARPWPFVSELLSPDALRRAGHFDADKVSLLLRKAERSATSTGGLATLGSRDNQALVGIVSMQAWHQLFIESHRARPRLGH
ncbi:MAG: asparagine synthase (glutamine-hydrolyzing) [Burkholderiales bacterium]|nr:asparagine synthase (glutamine-hydrolyzing) [Burkholderiales bacterium]MBH2016895.1 asparagine synthase (glutamine-hydrolyzing) [Burkholderiales bacterium]